MRRYTAFYLLALTSGLTACNQPAVSLKPAAFQGSENTVRDWNDVAHLVADEIEERGLLLARPFFVRAQAPDAAFVQQVADELESDILRRGGTIAMTSNGATVVNLDVEFVQWGPRDKPPGLIGLSAVLGELGIAMTPTMNAEAIWKATIVTSDRVVMKLQHPIYVRSKDIPLYTKTLGLGAVASASGTGPLQAKAVRYAQ